MNVSSDRDYLLQSQPVKIEISFDKKFIKLQKSLLSFIF
jgi:hypothetical protein